jgi:hypothetical protein
MPIPMSKYINITSGVGGAGGVSVRQLIGMVFTTSAMVDTLDPIVFSGGPTAALAAISAFFGASSEEYLRAALYFSYVSPSIRAPQSLSFARFARTDSPWSIFGAEMAFSLATLKTVIAGLIAFNFGDAAASVTAGSFVVGQQYTITSVGTTNFTLIGASANTVGVVFIATGVGTGTGTAEYNGVVTVGSINLSGAADLAGVASALQTALRLSVDTRLATCTVTYDAVNSRFDFVASGTVATAPFSVVQIGTGVTDTSNELGWYASQGALIISAQTAQTPVQAFTQASNITNNFGSFCFTFGCTLTLAEQTAVATYNGALNLMFQYSLPVSPSNYSTTSAALLSISGVGMTYELATLNQFPEMIPMAIMAATDYTQRNGVTNFDYRQIPGITASVTGTASDPVTYTALDAARVNYYGTTQEAGQNISFYQDGVLTGLSTSPQAMNTFANEQWLKSYIAAAFLSLQLALPQFAANKSGIGQAMAVLNDAVSKGLFNGVISVGKPLSLTQQLYVTQQTGDDNAWIQVQNAGYWYTVSISSSVVNGATVYTLNYTLIYSKNDAVRSVVGTHVLI